MTHDNNQPNSIKLAKQCANLLVNKKAQQLTVLDLRGLASYTDCLVIASATSIRHVTTLGQHLTQQLTQDGIRPLSTEGETGSSWMLLDYGDVVVHLFDEETRLHYDLEGLWADAPHIA
ncbi:MAG: ribosome silencing factor [Myxococcota bacterium]